MQVFFSPEMRNLVLLWGSCGCTENIQLLLSATIKSYKKDGGPFRILNHNLWGKRSQQKPYNSSPGPFRVIRPYYHIKRACSLSVTVCKSGDRNRDKMVLTSYSCSRGEQGREKHREGFSESTCQLLQNHKMIKEKQQIYITCTFIFIHSILRTIIY